MLLTMRLVYCLLFLIFWKVNIAQSITDRIQTAYSRFENDSQLRSAISSLYVMDGKTGEVVFEKNSKVGLATASTLKIVTAASAYEILGKDFRYETKFGYTGKVQNKRLNGNWFIQPSGDPTLGSWRWKSTSEDSLLYGFSNAVQKLAITAYAGIDVNKKLWNEESIPDGWIWQDIGNYYGAGAGAFNWRENQVDVILKSGPGVGDPVAKLAPNGYPEIISEATSGPKGSGDNAYVYYPLYMGNGVVRGTIPVGEDNFKISASIPDPAAYFMYSFQNVLSKQKTSLSIHLENLTQDTTYLISHYSPSLDSIIYWFLKKSINLYGEALLKRIAYEKTGLGSTDKGATVVKRYWKDKGIDPLELNIVDGSGLSPLDRVTTHAQVQVLQYAKQQTWFTGYYDAFPVYNEMKMKSGTIHGVKGFCGYQTAKDGHEYIFSFLVNNYNGSAGSLVQKMYKVLDELK